MSFLYGMYIQFYLISPLWNLHMLSVSSFLENLAFCIQLFLSVGSIPKGGDTESKLFAVSLAPDV